MYTLIINSYLTAVKPTDDCPTHKMLCVNCGSRITKNLEFRASQIHDYTVQHIHIIYPIPCNYLKGARASTQYLQQLEINDYIL